MTFDRKVLHALVSSRARFLGYGANFVGRNYIGIWDLFRDRQTSWPVPSRLIRRSNPLGYKALVKRTAKHVAAGRVLAIRPMHAVEHAQSFADSVAEIYGFVLERESTLYVYFPKIRRWVAAHYPLGDCHANAAGGLNTNRVKSGRDEVAFEFRRFTDEVAIIGRETLRPVKKRDTPVSPIRGTRRIAPSRIGITCSRSSGSSPKEKS